MKVKNLLSELDTSSEPVSTSNYVRYLGLQHYEPGMQYDAHECLLQLLGKIYSYSQHFVMIVVTLQILMVCILTGLCI